MNTTWLRVFTTLIALGTLVFTACCHQVQVDAKPTNEDMRQSYVDTLETVPNLRGIATSIWRESRFLGPRDDNPPLDQLDMLTFAIELGISSLEACPEGTAFVVCMPASVSFDSRAPEDWIASRPVSHGAWNVGIGCIRYYVHETVRGMIVDLQSQGFSCFTISNTSAHKEISDYVIEWYSMSTGSFTSPRAPNRPFFMLWRTMKAQVWRQTAGWKLQLIGITSITPYQVLE